MHLAALVCQPSEHTEEAVSPSVCTYFSKYLPCFERIDCGSLDMVAIRGGNEVNTKGMHPNMHYERFPMLICEGKALPKCEWDPIKMKGIPYIF